MIGKRMKSLREEKKMSLKDLSALTGKSQSTLSRYERDIILKYDPTVINDIAIALETSISYLLGLTENQIYTHDTIDSNDASEVVLVTDNDMSPEIPNKSLVKIRPVESNEKLQVGSFYYIEFNGKKCFRMVVDDQQNGISFMPLESKERRIACDKDYVDILGKAISMQVFFEDKKLY